MGCLVRLRAQQACPFIQQPSKVVSDEITVLVDGPTSSCFYILVPEWLPLDLTTILVILYVNIHSCTSCWNLGVGGAMDLPRMASPCRPRRRLGGGRRRLDAVRAKRERGGGAAAAPDLRTPSRKEVGGAAGVDLRMPSGKEEGGAATPTWICAHRSGKRREQLPPCRGREQERRGRVPG